MWYLDADGNGSWSASDQAAFFGQAGDTAVAGDWNGASLNAVEEFRIENGSLHVQRTDGSWEVIQLTGALPNQLLNSQPEEDRPGEFRSIIGDTSTPGDVNARYVNSNGTMAANTLLDAVGRVLAPGSSGSGVLLNRGGNQFVLTADLHRVIRSGLRTVVGRGSVEAEEKSSAPSFPLSACRSPEFLPH